jgi:transcriptional regulator
MAALIRRNPDRDNSRDEIPPGTLYLLILKTLAVRGRLHGYEIAESIQSCSDEVLQVEEGSLYPALQRLLKAKLVKAEWGLSSTNRRVRTYQITALGLRHLEKQISSFERMFEGITLVLNPGKSSA